MIAPNIRIVLDEGRVFVTSFPANSYEAEDIAAAVGQAAGRFIDYYRREQERHHNIFDPDIWEIEHRNALARSQEVNA